MTQFVVVVPIPDKTSATLAKYFMQYVFLKFGIYHILTLDDGCPFTDAFIAISKSLNINPDTLTKRNHKGLLVEKFHRFINKAITITVQDRGTNDIFVADGFAAEYAWNSSPIKGTYILRTVPVIGRELRFQLDIDLRDLHISVSNNKELVISYLRLTDSNSHFDSAIFENLIENRRAAHAERINNSRNIVTIHPSDIVMARTAIQSNNATDKVAKLCYGVQGLFQIVRGTGRDSYIVRKLIKLDRPELKFISEYFFNIATLFKTI